VTYTQEQAEERVLRLDPDQQVRRWGWEIETPMVAEIMSSTRWQDREGLNFESDPSLSGGECECECSDCYHSCNCDNCDRADYLDHCSECAINEVSSIDPVMTGTLDRWATFLDSLCREWVEQFRGENWGGHLHIEARDLTKRQAVNVVVAGCRIIELAPEWFSGGVDTYNDPPRRDELENCVKGQIHPHQTRRQSWISITNLPAEPMPYQIGDEPDGRKTTIEFRVFRSTADRRLIEFRALVARKLIEYCQTKVKSIGLLPPRALSKPWESWESNRASPCLVLDWAGVSILPLG
jgi:hypothetical protein